MGFFDSLLQGVTGALTGNPFGVISGVGGLVTSAIGASGSKKQADASLAATRETNAQNYKIWQEQKQHEIDMFNLENDAAVDMWNMQNTYNSPAAQAARLSGAGFNPYLAMGGGNPSGVATSAPQVGNIGSAPAPAMQTPDPSAFGSAMTYFAEKSVSAFSQLAQGMSNIGTLPSQIGVNNSVSRFNNSKSWTEENYGWKLVREQLRAAIDANDFFENTKDIQRSQMIATFNATVASTAGQMLSNEQIAIVNAYIGAEKWYNLNLMAAQILKLQSEGKLLDMNIETFMTDFLSRMAVNKSVVEANEASADASNAAARLNNANAYAQELDNRVAEATFTPEMAKDLGHAAAQNIKMTYLLNGLTMGEEIDFRQWQKNKGTGFKKWLRSWNDHSSLFFEPLEGPLQTIGSMAGKKAPVTYQTGPRYTTINN